MSESNMLFLNNDIANAETSENSKVTPTNEKTKQNLYAIVFLSTVAGAASLIGFGNAVAATKKKDPKFFSEGMIKGVHESGASLALRALGWGTVWAFTGCGILFYGIWKVSGATNAQEFRMKMGSILPRIPKNDPPQSRTEFEGLTDLLTYLSEDWGKKKE